MEEEIVIHPPAPLAKRIALLVAVLVISGLGVAMAASDRLCRGG